MQEKKLLLKENICRIARIIGRVLCLLFCAFTAVLFLFQKEYAKVGMAILSIIFVLIPDLMQKLFRFRIQTPLYFLILLYTICPLLGYSYKFYYLLPWWDDLLHCFAGVIFAMFGAYVPRLIHKDGKNSVAFCAVFALAFSIAVAAVWEFIEYGTDSLFGTDMQKDTLLAEVRPSYLLGEFFNLPVDEMAILGKTTTVINGVTVQGYVDLGLIDTMSDMLIESFGAVIYTAVYAVGKGKFFVFAPIEADNSCHDSPSFVPGLEDEAALSR